MISSIRGSVLSAGLDNVVVEVGGVGMLVHTTPAHAASARAGTEATFFTTLVVREDSLTLYGFGDDCERKLFELVQTVSGVGPRLALAMLAVHAPDALRGAIAGGDVPTLVKVPGIGKKGAERLVLELRDKIAAPPTSTDAAPASSPTPEGQRDPVRDALVGLGWNVKQADAAMDRVIDRDGAGQSVPALLKAALRELGR